MFSGTAWSRRSRWRVVYVRRVRVCVCACVCVCGWRVQPDRQESTREWRPKRTRNSRAKPAKMRLTMTRTLRRSEESERRRSEHCLGKPLPYLLLQLATLKFKSSPMWDRSKRMSWRMRESFGRGGRYRCRFRGRQSGGSTRGVASFLPATCNGSFLLGSTLIGYARFPLKESSNCCCSGGGCLYRYCCSCCYCYCCCTCCTMRAQPGRKRGTGWAGCGEGDQAIRAKAGELNK